MRVTVKPTHLANPDAASEVGKTPYAVNVPSAADLKKQMRHKTKTKNSIAPPLTNIERLKRREKSKGKNAEMKAEVAALRRTVRARCNELADLYDKKPRYLMDMFYQRSDQAAKNTYEVNPFNAYKSVVAHERREAGETPLHLLKLQSTITQDYHDLDDEALEKIVEKFKEICDKDKREKLKCPSVKEKMADVAKSVDNIMTVMQGLKTHCGIEFVGLVVKNRPEPFMNPKWLATDGRIHDYLSLILRGWDPTYIGKKVEAFAVAGCDATKIFKSQKDQGEALKQNIVRLVQDGLDQTCGTENQLMQYERFDTTITMRYHVVVEGWPTGIPFQKPSAFGGALEPLFRLRNAWQTGETRFRKLSDEEFQGWLAERTAKIEKGDIIPKARKKRCDAGVKRSEKVKGKERASGGGDDDGEESESGEKDSDEEESESGGSGGDTEVKDAERPKKKTKTTTNPSATTGKPAKKTTKTTRAAKAKVPKKPRITRKNVKSSKLAVDVDADTPDANSGPADTSPPASITPTPSVAEIRPRPQPRPVVPRKPAKPVEEDNSEQVEEGAAPVAPAAPDTVADAVDDTQHDAPEAAPDELQAPSATSTDTFDYSVMDPTLRPDPSNGSPPVASPIGVTVEAPPTHLKRKRKSEQERLQEDAVEHGAMDNKRGRVAVRRRHLGAGSFAPKSKAVDVNSDDEGMADFELC
ncbi:hypothetical protein V5O48_014656 [Marasmius crinis-equi]|uniref:Uncharacterized protein n=1 Tax=Marasmius crinis-equi TaxID=585013 RepID=A0ABR3EWP4_9AGAR